MEAIDKERAFEIIEGPSEGLGSWSPTSTQRPGHCRAFVEVYSDC